MESSATHSETLGVAASSSGSYGTWSANGTSTASSGVTFTWAQSIAYRDYRDQHRYGRYRWYCSGIPQSSWQERERYGTGGYTTAYSANPGFTYSCPSVSAGQWERSRSDGYHFKLSGGVQISALLGINLSLDTNWDTAHTLYYKLLADGRICGDNAVPSLAGRVRTSR